MMGNFNKSLDFSGSYCTPRVVGEAAVENPIHKLALTTSDKHTYVSNYTKWVKSTVSIRDCCTVTPFEASAQQLGDNCHG